MFLDRPRPDAVDVLRRLGGTAEWSELLRHTTSFSIRKGVADGTVKRTSRGTYALPEAPPGRQAALALRGVMSHDTAAAHWLMEGLMGTPSRVHVTVPRGAHPAPRRHVTIHYRDLSATDDHSGVTSPLRTVLDCSATLPFREALAIADSALRRELLTADELVEAAVNLRGAGRRRILRVATLADGRAANPLESGLRAIAIDAGLRGFEPQVEVITGSSKMRVDLGDERRRLALEADSFTYHGSRAALARDCWRYDELVRHGWTVLRFAWEHVLFDPAWIAGVLTDTCSFLDVTRNPTRRKSR